MRWEVWEGFYRRIVAEMGYSVEDDRAAALELRGLLLRHGHLSPGDIEIDERVYVFGAGPSLEDALEEGEFDDGTLIAADGATSALLRRGLVPDIVVTDLDGRIEDILTAREEGAKVVVHAHGDNVERLRRWVPELVPVLGTCQVEPLDVVHNFGGFTDGDRAAFLAEALGAREVTLIGFDFNGRVGRWSKPWLSENVPAWEEKERKLRFAEELLRWLGENGRAKIRFYRPGLKAETGVKAKDKKRGTS